jgi:quercetin dioxygenase-like cupin family protein
MLRTFVLSSVLLLGLSVAWIHGEQGSAPAQPAPVNPANFTGTVTPHQISDIRTLRYHFDAGARTNWHSHAGGQVIYVEEGRARAQERGKLAREFVPGDTFHTAPGVVHWHGAGPNAGMTQVAMSFGATNWLEKVSDEEYSRSSTR